MRIDLVRAALAMSLAQARKLHGLSQAALADKAAITQQQLSKLEKGKSCNLTTVLRVCAALGLELGCAPVSYTGKFQAKSFAAKSRSRKRILLKGEMVISSANG